MSDKLIRCCCNCRRNKRSKGKYGTIVCHCEIDGHYIGYLENFDGWCRRWAKDKFMCGEVETKDGR